MPAKSSAVTLISPAATKLQSNVSSILVVLRRIWPHAHFHRDYFERRRDDPMTQVTIYHNPPYAQLGLGDAHWTDDELDRMLQFPILINRPIVITPWGAKLCRPSEVVLDILPLPQLGPFVKEDGEPVIDSDGRRVSSRGH